MLNYVNTIIAIFLGWLILDEKITTKFIFAAILIISGVIMSANRESVYRIQQMDCPTEEKIIRNKLKSINEIVDLRFNLKIVKSRSL